MDSLEKYCERKKIIKKIFQNGLAKTRHLYKHIRKSPHKYLYFPEEARDIVRPNMVEFLVILLMGLMKNQKRQKIFLKVDL